MAASDEENTTVNLAGDRIRGKKVLSLSCVHELEPEKKVKTRKRKGTDEDDNEIRQPTVEELIESQKPQYYIEKITVRERKRLKHRLRQDGRDLHNHVQKVTQYLLTWKNNRFEWKFKKVRQARLIDFSFDEEKVNDHLWPVALEYLSSTLGLSKTYIIQKASKLVSKIDKEVESTGNTDLLNKAGYRRAREVLQNLQ